MTDIKITYNKGFGFTGRSPVLGAFTDELVSKRKMDDEFSLKAFEEAKAVSTTTVYNWINGKTRRPQFDKVAGAMHVLGLDVVFRRRNGK